MRLFVRVLILLILLIGVFTVRAADTPPITADNVLTLESVAVVDFATELPDDVIVETGWFTMNSDGTRIASVRRDGGLLVWSDAGELVETVVLPSNNDLPHTILDARFAPSGEAVATISTVDGLAFFAGVIMVESGMEPELIEIPGELGLPVRVWFDDETPHLWLETAPDDTAQPYQIVRLPYGSADDRDLIQLDSAPEADRESFVRIGRIPAPLAVTATPDGLVRLWDLEAGDFTYEVQLDQAPVFGRVNETTGTQLVWRSATSDALNLLDFATGDNTVITDLAGVYVQAYLLPPALDVVLGVHVDDDPVVVAWDAATGDTLNLGPYRPCGRVPDMVQLSADGTTLVIGCDTGLDVWRVLVD